MPGRTRQQPESSDSDELDKAAKQSDKQAARGLFHLGGAVDKIRPHEGARSFIGRPSSVTNSGWASLSWQPRFRISGGGQHAFEISLVGSDDLIRVHAPSGLAVNGMYPRP